MCSHVGERKKKGRKKNERDDNITYYFDRTEAKIKILNSANFVEWLQSCSSIKIHIYFIPSIVFSHQVNSF